MADDQRPELINRSTGWDGVHTITPKGELDLETIGELRPAVEEAIDRGAHTIVFDLAEVPFLDSSALALFTYAAQHVKQIILRNPSDIVRRVVTATGLSSLLAFEP